MAASSPALLPAQPPSVAEWEDLLLRMEIMQRVLRNTLEGVPAGDPGAAELLGEMVARERRVGAWLERVSGSAAEARPAAAELPGDPDAHALVDRFVSLRARNFAMLQRRGLEVWRWTDEFDGFGRVSAFQIVAWLVAGDVRSLAALRERASRGTAAC